MLLNLKKPLLGNIGINAGYCFQTLGCEDRCCWSDAEAQGYFWQSRAEEPICSIVFGGVMVIPAPWLWGWRAFLSAWSGNVRQRSLSEEGLCSIPAVVKGVV